MRRFRLLPAGLLLLVHAMQAGAVSTWVLKNGDRVTGELTQESASEIKIRHSVMGTLVLPRENLQPTKAATPARSAKPAVQWKRQVEFGLMQASGAVAQRNLSLRVLVDAKAGRSTHRLAAGWADAESAGTTLTARRDAEYRWRHDATVRLFMQSLSTYETDDIRGLGVAAEQQLGGGYRLIAGQDRQLNAGVGVAGLYRESSGLEPEIRIMGSLFQDYAHTLTPGLKFTQEARVGLAGRGSFSPRGGGIGGAPVPAGDDDYRVQFRAGLQGRVNESLNFNVRYEYDCDQSLTTPADRRLTTSLGYSW